MVEYISMLCQSVSNRKQFTDCFGCGYRFEIMSTVDKALGLLQFFSLSNPEWGLSDLGRAAALDKATLLRLLRSLERHGLIEQDAETKRFRLGTAFLTLARIREQSFPLATVVARWLDELSRETGETAHASLSNGRAMTTIGISEPQRATRVFVDPSEPLPFHATASGIVFLAFGPDDVRETVLSQAGFVSYTETTDTSPAVIRRRIEDARRLGYAASNQAFERDTIGIAVPLFDKNALAMGAIAVATPLMRMTKELQATILGCLMRTSVAMAESLGGALPPGFASIARGHA